MAKNSLPEGGNGGFIYMKLSEPRKMRRSFYWLTFYFFGIIMYPRGLYMPKREMEF